MPRLVCMQQITSMLRQAATQLYMQESDRILLASGLPLAL